MGAGHGHGHGHGVAADGDRRFLRGALALIVVFMTAEVGVGVAAGSLALLSDAAHMLTDAFAIAAALLAMRIAARPPSGRFTYGLKRAEILSAQLNGLTLLLLAAYFAVEGVRRLLAPHPVEGAMVLATALAGIAVNLAATWLLRRADRSKLHVEGAYQHIFNDLLAFVATAAAGAVIMVTGWNRADAVASLVVAALMVKAGAGLVRDAGRVLMQATPDGMDAAEMSDVMAALPDVAEVRALHVWEVTSGHPTLSAHLLLRPGGDCHAVRRQARRLLRDAYGITHTTLEVDHTEGADVRCAAHGHATVGAPL
ncbi:cation diffusion facilitator family transporter [Actinocorallia sp. API 0066]|uniref:cation diffusion facilitator family transporter n=1 Tax=Actinocorallia sp. API 0066 TaxID=2896846 RepID=UPI001E4C9977|nr:cation diffusion facilitator family transporter [Actinocorallia sp. API 0066]MCD0448677.1 cation diffusion facilitator family transporter [Actinocorallia sp. API 0066]